MRIRRTLTIVLALSMALALLVGCGGGAADTATGSAAPTGGAPATDSAPPPSQSANLPAQVVPEVPEAPPEDVEFYDSLICVSSDRISTLDTADPTTTGIALTWQFHFIYDTLVLQMPDGTYAPSLAKSWDSDDYQTYDFKLRDDVYFHNGEKFTAEDVAFNIDRAKASPGGAPIHERMGTVVESYNIVNDYEITVTLTAPNVDYIPNISWIACGIVSKKAIESDPENGHLIGTGKYSVERFVPNELVAYKRNDNYWGTVPPTKAFEWRTVLEETARYTMLENDEAQIQWQPAPAFMPGLMENPDLDYLSIVVNNTLIMGFNLLNPILGDINFRRAIAHTIDRDELILFSRDGWGVAPNPPLPWGYATEFRNNDVYIPERDLNKAKEYLAQTSYNGESLVMWAPNPISVLFAQVLQEQLAEVGINVTVREVDGPTYLGGAVYGETQHEIILGGQEFDRMASSTKQTYYPGLSGNRFNYNNPEVAALYDEAAVTIDAAKRESLYRKIQELIAEDLPWLLVMHTENIIATRKGVEGIWVYPTNAHDFSGAYLIKS